MWNQLPLDAWQSLLFHLSVDDVVALHCVCSDCHVALAQLDDWHASVYAVAELKDSDFWTRATRRPHASSHPLTTYLQEMLRIEAYRKCHVHPASITASHFYELWKSLD